VIRNPGPADDSAILDLVSRGYVRRPGEWIRWAIRENPSFRDDLSAVAEEDGKIVGTYLSATNPVKLGASLEVTGITSLIVVDPEYRRRGIGTALVKWARTRRCKAGGGSDPAVVRFGIASRETRKIFWSRLTTSPTMEEGSVLFTKLVVMEPLEDAATAIDQASLPARSSPFSIRIDVTGSVPFTLEIGASGVKVTEAANAAVEISGEISSLGYRSLTMSLLTGRLRLKGYRHIFGLLRCRRVLNQFFSALQSKNPQ
jgi:GNAT superfamily N-acetyltransferase